VELERRRALLMPNTAAIPWAYWCNATSDNGISYELLVCRSGARLRDRRSGTTTWVQSSFVVATDAPLIPTQLKHVAKRVTLGLGRDGSYSGNGSGDIFIAFSTANPGASSSKSARPLTMLPNDQINPVFLATVQATEEAVVNAMIAAETMTGVNGHTVIALPHDRLRELMKKYNRVAK